MEHIWHANCEIESRTLDVHIKTLRHKLEKPESILRQSVM